MAVESPTGACLGIECPQMHWAVDALADLASRDYEVTAEKRAQFTETVTELCIEKDFCKAEELRGVKEGAQHA